jgi:ribosome biogenesis GTPase / thiamine phosphate phosphatase
MTGRDDDSTKHRSRRAAGRLRRSFVRDKGGDRNAQLTEDNWEELLDEHGHSRRRKMLVSEMLEELADDSEEDFEAAAIVIAVMSARCRVFDRGEERDCIVPPHIAMKRKSALAVGDRVVVAPAPAGFAAEGGGGTWRVESVLPRRSVLARPDPLHKHLQRLIAANIDVVVNVVSVKAPPLRPRLIDRVLIAIQRGGAQPVICVNKIDLVECSAAALGGDRLGSPAGEGAGAPLILLAPYRDLGVPVILCSTKSGEGLDELRAAVEGKMAALVGHSGVGKSSILNALDERLQLATGGLHRRGTGRHTTTRSTLYDFGGGTLLIDTPGIREFGLWDLDRESLRDYFPEFSAPSEFCRFTDCTHVHEPDCEVKRRVEAGTLDRARYETYARLYADLA